MKSIHKLLAALVACGLGLALVAVWPAGAADTKVDAKKPDAKKPAAAKPDAKKPDAKKPDAKKPDAAKADATAALRAGDWPQWGGTPERNNTPDGKNIPTDWKTGKFDRKTSEWDKSSA